MKTDNPQTLADAAHGGDEWAFQDLLTHFEPMMIRLVYRIEGPEADRDDLMQAGAMGLWYACLTYDASRGVPFTNWAWMQVHARIGDAVKALQRGKHRILTYARSLDGGDEHGYGYDDIASGGDFTEAVDAAFDGEPRIRAFVADLSPLERRVLAARYVGTPAHHIARTWQVPYKQIDNALQRIRSKARRVWSGASA